MERIKLGRESLERRRQQNKSSSVSTALCFGADAEEDVTMADATYRESTVIGSGATCGDRRHNAAKADRQDIPYNLNNDEIDDNDDNDEPMNGGVSTKSKVSNGVKRTSQTQGIRECESERVSIDEKAKAQSRFTEGSMRDRVSEPPPMEIIGPGLDSPTHETSSQNGVDAASAAPMEKEGVKKKRSFIFGLGSFFKFNPFGLVSEAKAAYIRQKTLHERKKEEMKQRKKEIEEIYWEMKARGDFRGTFVRHKDDIEEPVGIDENGVAVFSESLLVGSARKRKLAEIADGSGSTERERSMDGDNSDESGSDDMIEDNEIKEEDNSEADVRPRAPHHVHNAPLPRKTEKSQSRTVCHIVKKTSEVFANAISPTSLSSSSSLPSSINGRPLTKRELKKRERLQKRVSNLEEQLEKARHELEENMSGNLPPVPDVSQSLMPPPPLPSVTRSNANHSNREETPPLSLLPQHTPTSSSPVTISAPLEYTLMLPESPVLGTSRVEKLADELQDESMDIDTMVDEGTRISRCHQVWIPRLRIGINQHQHRHHLLEGEGTHHHCRYWKFLLRSQIVEDRSGSRSRRRESLTQAFSIKPSSSPPCSMTYSLFFPSDTPFNVLL
jgi:hypothetical protein